MQSMAWLSEKGGSGKTTSVINTAVALARLGKKVLVLDCDPQANATLVFLHGRVPDPPTLFHVLDNRAGAGEAIRKTGTRRLDLMPASELLADANVSLATATGRERRLRLAMQGVDEAYDFVIVDTSPQRTLINVNVLNYVASVFCPVDPGIFSLAGLGKLQNAIAEVVTYLDNRELRLAGLVLTRVARDNLSRDVAEQVRGAFGPLVLETMIPANTKIGEAHARYLSVLDYAPRSPGAEAYMALTREILAHGTEHGVGERGVQPDAADSPADCAA